ncbi:tRNA pseudouridine synthase A [Moraxella caviae]|nr:tRNA pseudouridine synthase A [Moraxella caviae]
MSDGAQTYAVGIEFIGTRYRGWQRQEEVVGVQAVLENALSKIANEPIELIAAGRTDAGVHAGNMIAHFTTTAKRRFTAGCVAQIRCCQTMSPCAGLRPCPAIFTRVLVQSPDAIATSRSISPTACALAPSSNAPLCQP